MFFSSAIVSYEDGLMKTHFPHIPLTQTTLDELTNKPFLKLSRSR